MRLGPFDISGGKVRVGLTALVLICIPLVSWAARAVYADYQSLKSDTAANASLTERLQVQHDLKMQKIDDKLGTLSENVGEIKGDVKDIRNALLRRGVQP